MTNTETDRTFAHEEEFFIEDQMDYLVLHHMLKLEEAGREIVWRDILAIRLRHNLAQWSALTPQRQKDQEAAVRGTLSRLYRKGALSRPGQGRYMLNLTGVLYYEELVGHLASALDIHFVNERGTVVEKDVDRVIRTSPFSYNDFSNIILNQEDLRFLAYDAYQLSKVV